MTYESHDGDRRYSTENETVFGARLTITRRDDATVDVYVRGTEAWSEFGARTAYETGQLRH